MRVTEWMDRYFHVRKCGGCGRILSFEDCYEAFCQDCRLKWSVAKAESCSHCFQSVAECTCQPKALSNAGALVLRKLFFYSAKREYEPQNRILYHIKKKPNHRLFHFFASELASSAKQELSVLGLYEPYENVVIVSMPRGGRARATYGFDQAECIARNLGQILHIPYVSALYRTLGGREQKHLTARERQNNMKKRIRVRNDDAICGKCVLLLDDVVTTGSSMSVCVSALRKAGAKYVLALSVAQTP